MHITRSPCFSKLKKRLGFTLPEILVCLGGVIALSTAAIVGSDVILKNGRYNSAKASAAAISIAVSQYKFETGTYPVNLTALTAADETTGKGPWMHSENLTDPWHRDFQYYTDGTTGFAVWSTGPDGTNNSGTPTVNFNSGGTGDDIGVFGR